MIDYNNLPITIISPFTGAILSKSYDKKEVEDDEYILAMGDYSHEYREFCFNDEIIAVYRNDETDEYITIV